MLVLMIVGSIHSMVLDELMMGRAQSRIGPFNLGGYGFLPSSINGRNSMISQFPVPKLHLNFGSQSFPMFSPPFPLQNYIPLYPFSLVDIYLPLIIRIWLMGLSMVLILFPAFPSRSKHSMLGCIRMMPQLMSLELMWTTIILISIRSWNELPIASYRSFVIEQPALFHWFVCYRLISNNHLFLIFFFMCISGESNRVPHDLPEAEPESVAGFITEYSPVISPFIPSTEYANIIAVSSRMIIPSPPNYDRFLFFLLFVRLIRTTSNRLKSDELMTNARIVIPPVMSSLLLLLFNFDSYLFFIFILFTLISSSGMFLASFILVLVIFMPRWD